MPDQQVLDSNGPTISIAMEGDLIVMRPHGYLDLESTRTLVSAVDAAAGAATTVVIDLDGTYRETGGHEPAHPTHAHAPGSAGVASIAAHTIDVVAPGCVRLSAPDNHWTIDLAGRRFCRSAAPVDRRFVGPDDWIAIRTIWATEVGVSVLTSGDAIISTSTRWVAA
jgi:hypothetical protein